MGNNNIFTNILIFCVFLNLIIFIFNQSLFNINLDNRLDLIQVQICQTNTHTKKDCLQRFNLNEAEIIQTLD